MPGQKFQVGDKVRCNKKTCRKALIFDSVKTIRCLFTGIYITPSIVIKSKKVLYSLRKNDCKLYKSIELIKV